MKVFIQRTAKNNKHSETVIETLSFDKIKWQLINAYLIPRPLYTSWSSDSSGFFSDNLLIVTLSRKAFIPNSRHTPFPFKTDTTKGMMQDLLLFSFSIFSMSSSSSLSWGDTSVMSTWTVIVSVGGILEGIGLLSYAENNSRRNNNLGLNNACLVLCLLSLLFFLLLTYQMVENSHL